MHNEHSYESSRQNAGHETSASPLKSTLMLETTQRSNQTLLFFPVTVHVHTLTSNLTFNLTCSAVVSPANPQLITWIRCDPSRMISAAGVVSEGQGKMVSFSSWLAQKGRAADLIAPFFNASPFCKGVINIKN